MSIITVGKENSTSDRPLLRRPGSGSPVVLIHGWPLSGASWEKQTAALLAAGHRVITYDRRGFGRSSKPASATTTTRSRPISSGVDEARPEDVALVGFSMGTGEVTRYIGKYGTTRVRKAVLIGTLGPYLVKAADNPEGVDRSVFDGIKAAIRADRPAFLLEFLHNFYNYDVTGGKLVSERVLEDNWNVAVGASADRNAGLRRRVDRGLPQGHAEEHRADAHPARRRRSNPAAGCDVPKAGEDDQGRQARRASGGPHGVLWTHAERINTELVGFLAGLVDLLGLGDDRLRRRDAGGDHHFANRGLGFG